jgi:putative endonuclease
MRQRAERTLQIRHDNTPESNPLPSLAFAFNGGGRMTLQRQTLGIRGEDLAVGELERHGYAVLERRYRTRHGEIDIVARDGETIVFVEVKVKETAEFGTAAHAVDARKQRRVISMAIDYLARNRLTSRACRFDVVAIDGVGEDAIITHYPGAFTAT